MGNLLTILSRAGKHLSPGLSLFSRIPQCFLFRNGKKMMIWVKKRFSLGGEGQRNLFTRGISILLLKILPPYDKLNR
jgi:hypothetical protein